MKWSRVGALGLVLLGTLVAFGQSPSADEPCCGEGEVKGDARFRDPPPCICPLWELENLGGGEFVYYAEYYENSCGEEPQATQAQGTYTLSTGCSPEPNHCNDASALLKRAKRPQYAGRADYIKHDEGFDLPPGFDGKGRECAIPILTTYISFQPHPYKTDLRYAKVFGYALDRNKRYDRTDQKNLPMYVGLEMAGPPPKGHVAPFASTERLEPVDITKECHIFRAVLRGPDPPMQIVLLTKGEGKPE